MKHNFINISKRLSMAALAATMVAAPAINVFAAPEDIIDTSKTASLTIHKYDMTAAAEDGVDINQFKANGKQDSAAEAQMAKYKIKGVEFTYQKVGDICTESVGGDIKVMYDIPAELEKILGLTDSRGDHKHTSDEINGAMKNILTSNTESKNKLEDYIKSGHGQTSMPLTDDNGVSTASSLPLGLYLIVETKVPANVHTTVDPFFVSLPMTDVEGQAWFYDVNVYPKNQTNIPDLDKVVRQNDDATLYRKPEYHNTATSSEGEQVDYLLISHLPKISSKATHLSQYTFVDKMSKGFKFNSDAEINFYNTAEDAKANDKAKAVATWESGSKNFRVQTAGNAETSTTITFEMTTDGLAALNEKSPNSEFSNFSDKYMVISYSGDVNSDATPTLGDAGNTNEVELEWKRTSMEYSDHLKDKARVFTYGIDLKKKFQNDDQSKVGDATKVAFSLQNKTDGHYVTATQLNPGSGIYYVTDSVKGDAEAKGTEFIPAADGTLIINGLEANDYVLTELRTDKGYTLLKEPINISIVATQDDFTPSKTTLYDEDDIASNPNKEVIEQNGERAKATVDGKETEMREASVTTGGVGTSTSTNALVKMVVTNTPGFKLPATGGAGTIIFTVAGCAVAFAGIAIVTKKSKKDEK